MLMMVLYKIIVVMRNGIGFDQFFFFVKYKLNKFRVGSCVKISTNLRSMWYNEEELEERSYGEFFW